MKQIHLKTILVAAILILIALFVYHRFINPATGG